MDGEKKAAKQKLILGTHTSEGEQNYLMIAEVALPTVDNEAEAGQYDEERGEVGGFGAATGRVQVGFYARCPMRDPSQRQCQSTAMESSLPPLHRHLSLSGTASTKTGTLKHLLATKPT